MKTRYRNSACITFRDNFVTENIGRDYSVAPVSYHQCSAKTNTHNQCNFFLSSNFVISMATQQQKDNLIGTSIVLDTQAA